MTGCNQRHTLEPQHLSPCQPRRRAFKAELAQTPGAAKEDRRRRTWAYTGGPAGPDRNWQLAQTPVSGGPGPTVQVSGIAFLLHADALAPWLMPAGPTRNWTLDAKEPWASQRDTRLRPPALPSADIAEGGRRTWQANQRKG